MVKNGAIDAGLKLLFNGKAERMVLVIHQPLKDDQLFALQERYMQLLTNESDRIGLGKGKFQITVVPFAGHPTTLNEARFVLTKLTQDGIRSAILLSKGFHTRRSFGVYNQEGARVGVRIIPSPYFIEYKNDNWWKHAKGVHDFFEQTIKLAYYLLRGYLSVKSLCVAGTLVQREIMLDMGREGTWEEDIGSETTWQLREAENCQFAKKKGAIRKAKGSQKRKGSIIQRG